MGVLWERQHGDTIYSVRSAGNTVRLYTNGVFHSQWNENKPFAGAIWDCLSLPVLYRAPEHCENIVMLGLGGGAGIRQLQRLVPFKNLLAVEIDAVHISIAEHWFGVRDETIKLVHKDAIRWMRRTRPRQVDLLIDDLFGHSGGEPQRAQPIEDKWVRQLWNALSPTGVLVVNCISRTEFKKSLGVFERVGFAQGFRWTLPEYDNAIGVFLKQPVKSSDWLSHLQETGLPAAMQRQARMIERRAIRF